MRNMSKDGHTGIENYKVNEGGSGHFRLILAVLKHSSGDVDFVIHASSPVVSQLPSQFLEQIGFSHFEGECPFYYDRCYYRIIATLKSAPSGFLNHNQVQSIHRNFKRFAEEIGRLYSLYQEQNSILREIGEQASAPTIFASPPVIEIEPSDIPLWVEEVKFERLKELELKVKRMNEEIEDLRGYLPLLFASGEMLVNSVIKALRYLGLKAEHAEEGFTIDILAQTKDGAKKFGFEVTGTNGPIKKESKKLTQVLEFERIKDNDEKTILIANTYNTTPISEREGKENFTPQVVNFLSRHPILLMTSWDLYRMVRDVMEKGRDPEEIIDILYNSVGVLEYESLD